MMEGPFKERFDKALRTHTEYELGWWKQDRRGRWVVLEPGPGQQLKGSPRHIRDYVNAITGLRGRRFSSLSRARAFAREVGGAVRRWRRRQKRGPWRLVTNPWECVRTPSRLYCSEHV